MEYKVTRQYLRGPEEPLAQFKEVKDAELFIHKKLQEDAAMNIKITYRLSDMIDMIKEYQPGAVGSVEESSSSSGKGSQAGFKPTPFDSSPRPAGMPKNWLVDEEDKDKDKK